MKTEGTLRDISIDYVSRKPVVSLEINADPEELERLREKPLSVELQIFRRERSLSANSYFHVLAGKLADKLKISKTRCKNQLITSYGQQEFLPDGAMAIIKSNVPPEQMWEQEWLHCLPFKTQTENGSEVYFYKIFRGSHTYNTAEMSYLIDCTVQEAKDQGIETLSPDKLKEMYELYGKHTEDPEG
ncbi:MAG: hypothetical protein LUD72_06990 [Bacteroidales bacterium]|nr:hypothetical protein [Bacteroidales bacterium]